MYISDTGTSRKLGVFAHRDWPKGHKIIVEAPALSCIHWRQRYGTRNVATEWKLLKFGHKEDLRKCFRKLRKVAMGSNDHLTKFDKKRLESFIDEYAFRPPQGDEAYVYKLASHINQACTSCANAVHWTDLTSPNAIHVTLVQPVKSGQEIFIYYNKSDLDLPCPLCTQPSSLMSRLKAFIKRLCKLTALKNRRHGSDSSTRPRKTSNATLVSCPPKPPLSTVPEDDHEKLSRSARVTVRAASVP